MLNESRNLADITDVGFIGDAAIILFNVYNNDDTIYNYVTDTRAVDRSNNSRTLFYCWSFRYDMGSLVVEPEGQKIVCF